MTPRQALMSFFEAMNRSDLDAAMMLLHPDFEEHYPQSGERIRGAANLKATIANYPGGLGGAVGEPIFHGRDEVWSIAPNFTVVRVTDAGNAGTGVVKVRYGNGSEWWMISLLELKDDLIHRQTTFFAEPFEAPGWRAPWVEQQTD